MYKINLSTGEYDIRDIMDSAKGYFIENEQGKQVFLRTTHQDELTIKEAMSNKPVCPTCGNNVYTKRFTVLQDGTQVLKCERFNCDTKFNQ
jgi:hypothetical protein